MLSELNVIVFDVPFPPSYGGVIDVYYRLLALRKEGISVNLHVFEYGERKRDDSIGEICNNVFYYKRRKIFNPFNNEPLIVASRDNEELLDNLLLNNAPILFDALHSCHLLDHELLRNRQKIVRIHNIEHDYYANLGRVESNPLKVLYFKWEAKLLEKFEKKLEHADLLLAISGNDEEYLASKFKKVRLLPAFHSNNFLSSYTGRGTYCFYHGKLSVGENNEAAKFLVREVFSNFEIPLIIAGDNPSAELKRLVKKTHNVSLFTSMSTEHIYKLIRNAHINVVPTFQSTGIKLKLINSLFMGRFALVNDFMVEGTGLESLCEIANNPNEFKEKIRQLFGKDFTLDEIRKREELLKLNFDNTRNVRKLIQWIEE